MKVIKRASMIILMLLLPVSVMGLTPVMDTDLAHITGQSGVNINADLTMNINIGTMAWGDADGITGAYNPWTTVAGTGYVGMTGFDIYNLNIKARETDTYNGYTTASLKPITIDVATDTTYVVYNGATFVRFGLGSLQITLDALDFDVELGATTALGQDLGRVSLGAIGIYINPLSYVDIYNSRPGSSCGVFFTFNIIVDEFQMGYMSWGDTDGLVGGSTGTGGVPWMSTAVGAGYIGLDNLVIGGPITITGTVAIDIVTSMAGVYANAAPVSVVRITFPRLFNVNVAGPITADVKLDSVAALSSANAGTLGDIYVSAFNLDIRAGSWVDIWAH